jgi:hypothetical protein
MSSWSSRSKPLAHRPSLRRDSTLL